MESEEKIDIRYPSGFRIIGIISILFGVTFATLCMRDYFRGNETASIELSFLFLLFFGSLGGFLVIYGGRRVTVHGKKVVVRNGLPGKKVYDLDHIKKVKGGRSGLVFCGEEEVLFKVYDNTCECERFISMLEKNGVEVDIFDRSFARSQSDALNPLAEQRSFTVNLGWFKALVMRAVAVFCFFLPIIMLILPAGFWTFLVFWPIGAVLWAVSCRLNQYRLKVSGGRMELQRTWGKVERYTVSELKEVRIKPWLSARHSVFRVKVFTKEGKTLFRLSCPALGFEDRNYVLAMVKYFRDSKVPVYGIEKLDERFICLLNREYLTEEKGLERCRQFYGLLEPVFKEYEPQFSAYGVKLSYGLLNEEEKEKLGKELPFVRNENTAYHCGVYICLKKEERLLYMKGTNAPLYVDMMLMSRPQKEGGRKNGDELNKKEEAFYFSPPSITDVNNSLRYLLQQTANRQIYTPE